jgi:hypothetical protein
VRSVSCGANLVTVADNLYIVLIEALDSSFRDMMPTIFSAGYIVQANISSDSPPSHSVRGLRFG